jgi:hypothetical protein
MRGGETRASRGVQSHSKNKNLSPDQHNQRIWTPRSTELKPDRDRLEQRYEMFRKAG